MSLTVAQAMELLANQSLTAEELMSECIETIRKKNPSINAFSDIYLEEAFETARDCDLDTKNGRCRGPLHGIPVGVKDLFLTSGRRTTRGSVAFREFVPNENAPIIDRIESAGAIVIGKTTTTEMGWSGSSVSELYGPTRNPWNTKLTSGGSSSGSAAAVATGMVPCALGSDGGGSVRIPASFCGIFAMKGSLARIPTYPWSPTEMLSHAGPLTRTATDSAILFNLLKGPDPRDHLALPDDGLDYLQCCIDRENVKVAFAPTLFGVDIDSEVAKAVAESVSRIEQCFGIKVEIVEPKWNDPIDIFETLWVAGRGIFYRDQNSDLENGFGEGFRNLIRASQGYTLANYLNAIKARAEFATLIHLFFEDYDFLLLPTVPILPFDAELEAPKNMPGKSEILPWTGWTPFTYPFNLSGNPAASMPIGTSSEGLPIGLQIIGRRHTDHSVLSFCRAFEEFDPFNISVNSKGSSI
jgi:aspartyl-tRNA(Asn)/glutamyl-tRNA(Gln) amidotransferase subunit A